MMGWLFILLFVSIAICSPRQVRVYFANPKYMFLDSNGLRRVTVLRNSVGVKGLPRPNSLLPCVEDAEVLSEFSLLEASMGAHRLEKHGFEFATHRLSDLLLEHRNAFGSTTKNVMDTVISPSFAALDSAMFLSIDPVKLPHRSSICLKCGGYIVRKVGPSGSQVDPDFPIGAEGMHIDQDIRGEPISSMFGVSWLLQYVPFVYLVNYWIPLVDLAIIRPLVVMDMTSLSEENVFHVTNGNDLKLVSFNNSQKVYFKPKMRFGEAAVFFTGFTPHSSTSLPGEACLLKNNGTAVCKDPDLLFLQSNFEPSKWWRHSIEMRCVVIVIPEQVFLVFVIALFAVSVHKLVQMN